MMTGSSPLARSAGVKFFLFAFFLTAASGRGLDRVPGSGRELQSPPTVSRVLENGLEVIAREDHSSPLVALQVWVKAGSIYEEEWLGAGLSHFVEHLSFKGPGEDRPRDIPGEIQNLGGEVGAYTSLDHTVFYATVPSENWRPALELLRELVMKVDFSPEGVEKEREVIEKEINMNRDDPSRRLNLLLWSTAFQVHPYRFPVIGYRDPLRQLNREDILEYYRKYYVPNNMFLIVVGDVKAGEVFRAASEVFLPDVRRPYPLVSIPPEPRQQALRKAEEEMDVSVARLALAFHIPSLHHPDLFALDVLALLAGQGKASSLYRKVREEEGLVHSISAYSYTPAYPGLFVVEAETDPEKAGPASSAILRVLEEYKETQVSPEELERARRQVISEYLHSLTTVEGQARDIGSDQLLTGSRDFSRRYVDGVNSVTAEDVRQAAKRYLRDGNLTLASVVPFRKPAAPLPAATPPAEEKVRKFTLENGLTVLVGEDHSLPLVSIRMVFEGGVLAESEKDNGVCHLVSRLLLKGTRRRSAREIAREIENNGGSIDSSSARNSFGCSVEIIASQLEPALAVLGDVVENCTFPPEELEKERKFTLLQIEAEKDEPMALAGRLFRETLFGGHPYRFSPLGSESAVGSLTAGDLMKFYRRYCCARNGVLAVFGDVRAEEVLSILRDRWAGLREGEKARLAGRFSVSLAGVKEAVEEKKGIEQEVLLLGFPGTDIFSPDRYALEFLDSVFSGLSAPLFLKVREEKALAYYVGAYQILGLDPGAYVFYAGTAPGRSGAVSAEIRDEIGRVKEGRLSSEEIERNRNRILGRYRSRLQTNSELAYQTALDELYGLGYRAYLDYEGEMKKLTAEDLTRAAGKYFKDDAYVRVIVRPKKVQNECKISN